MACFRKMRTAWFFSVQLSSLLCGTLFSAGYFCMLSMYGDYTCLHSRIRTFVIWLGIDIFHTHEDKGVSKGFLEGCHRETTFVSLKWRISFFLVARDPFQCGKHSTDPHRLTLWVQFNCSNVRLNRQICSIICIWWKHKLFTSGGKLFASSPLLSHLNKKTSSAWFVFWRLSSWMWKKMFAVIVRGVVGWNRETFWSSVLRRTGFGCNILTFLIIWGILSVWFILILVYGCSLVRSSNGYRLLSLVSFD